MCKGQEDIMVMLDTRRINSISHVLDAESSGIVIAMDLEDYKLPIRKDAECF